MHRSKKNYPRAKKGDELPRNGPQVSMRNLLLFLHAAANVHASVLSAPNALRLTMSKRATVCFKHLTLLETSLRLTYSEVRLSNTDSRCCLRMFEACARERWFSRCTRGQLGGPCGLRGCKNRPAPFTGRMS